MVKEKVSNYLAFDSSKPPGPCVRDHLGGLVVKASASRAEDPGFESRLRRDFSGSSHTSDIKIGTLETCFWDVKQPANKQTNHAISSTNARTMKSFRRRSRKTDIAELQYG